MFKYSGVFPLPVFAISGIDCTFDTLDMNRHYQAGLTDLYTSVYYEVNPNYRLNKCNVAMYFNSNVSFHKLKITITKWMHTNISNYFIFQVTHSNVTAVKLIKV